MRRGFIFQVSVFSVQCAVCQNELVWCHDGDGFHSSYASQRVVRYLYDHKWRKQRRGQYWCPVCSEVIKGKTEAELIRWEKEQHVAV